MTRRGDPLSPEDRRLWARITGTVAPRRAVKAARIDPPAPVTPEVVAPMTRRMPVPPVPAATKAAGTPSPPRPRAAPEALEPRRQRRLARERDPIEARIDLHGFSRFEAEDRLKAFLTGAQARGCRSVLVITGQGRRGGGVIRASIQEWLQAAQLRGVVSGYAVAHRRHGGDGAIYVTLTRR